MEQKNFFQRHTTLIVVIIVVLVVGGWFVSKYNNFITLGQEIDGQWAQVDVQLQRRFDLVPALMNFTKGLAAHEMAVVNSVTSARTQYAGARTTNEKAQAASMLEGSLARLLVIMENYPAIASTPAFTNLQSSQEGTENRISVERGKFNEKVKIYNQYAMKFPTVILAKLFGFSQRQYFDVPVEAEKAPNTSFTE